MNPCYDQFDDCQIGPSYSVLDGGNNRDVNEDVENFSILHSNNMNENNNSVKS